MRLKQLPHIDFGRCCRQRAVTVFDAALATLVTVFHMLNGFTVGGREKVYHRQSTQVVGLAYVGGRVYVWPIAEEYNAESSGRRSRSTALTCNGFYTSIWYLLV